MYCPQCGQQQTSSEMRFCSRCGFPLGGVAQLLLNGGTSPASVERTAGAELSPRQLGTRQGLMMMFSTLLIVPLVSLISVFIVGGEHLLIPIAALLTFVGGLLRIIYSRLYESDLPGVNQEVPSYVPPSQLNSRARVSALPPPLNIPIPDIAQRRMRTAELAPPPGITENTTRLLDEDRD